MNIRFKKLIKKHYKMLIIIFVIFSMPAVYALVYFTGGIKYVYSHTMYLPILVAGIFLGKRYGIIAGLVAGLLLGPLMPLVVVTNEPQALFNWLYRLIIFVLIGGISGYFSFYLKASLALNKNLTSINHETNIPNINYLLNLEATNELYSIFTLILSNKVYINEIFGYKYFNEAMTLTYKKLKVALPEGTHIIQSDSNKLWIMCPFKNIKLDTNSILNTLQEHIEIDNIRIYVEYYLGVEKKHTISECQNFLPFRLSDRLAGFAKKNDLPYVIYDSKNYKNDIEIDLLGDFSNALKENQTYLAYHPIVNLKTNKIDKLEALIRWNHPKKGRLMPINFIPLVENTHLVHQMLEWILKSGSNKINEFKESGLDTIFSFNLSGKNFHNPHLLEVIKTILKVYKINPKLIDLEITETILMDNPDKSKETIQKLKELGISVAIDDFGTGYSSLAYLSQFEIDSIKIDRFFISKIENKSDYEIIKSTINLAHILGYKVVAEGIETLSMLNTVKALGCDYAQGFYFCKPVHQDDIIEYFKMNKEYDIK